MPHIVRLRLVVRSRDHWIKVVLNEWAAFGFRGHGAQSLYWVLHSSSSHHEYQKDNHQNNDYDQRTCKLKIMWWKQSYCYIINCAEQKYCILMLCKLRSLHVKLHVKLQINFKKNMGMILLLLFKHIILNKLYPFHNYVAPFFLERKNYRSERNNATYVTHWK